MSINLAEEVQKRLLFPALIKIDPNTTEKKNKDERCCDVTQAAIITALVGLYRITRTQSGSVRLLLTGRSEAWLEDVYGDNLGQTVSRISECTHTDRTEVEKLLRLAADAAIIILHEQLAGNITSESFKEFMSAQRDHILVYLPPQLHLGEMLHDKTLDDNTHKMEGPVSSLMHKIENIFSEGQ